MLKVGLVGGLILVGLVVSYWWWRQRAMVVSPTLSDRQQIQIEVGTQNLTVEVVHKPVSITRGLSGRSEIGADGMLFIFANEQATSFWMKEMQFDLDMVWLKDGRVVSVTAQVPAPLPTTSLTQLPLYPSPGVVDMVLEIPAGQAEKWQIVAGADLKFK